MKTFRFCAMSLSMLGLICQFATYGWAQSYPAKAVRYLVPGSPGSGADIMGRIFADGLTRVFGQQVFVDNRPGGGNNIGVEIAAKAPADGYTLLQITMAHAINATLYRKLSYDLLRDFAPVTQVVSSTSVVTVHPSLPVTSIGELVKLAKARPGAINYASAGTGTPTFFAVELFKGMAGVDMLHVPYRGGGEAMNSILSGETSVYFGSTWVLLPFIKQGRLRALAVTTRNRLPFLPEYPTVAEMGYPGYESVGWYGLMVPAKTRKETITRIRDAVIVVLNAPDVSKQLTDMGIVAIGNTPEEFAAHIRAEIAKLGKIIRQFNMTAD